MSSKIFEEKPAAAPAAPEQQMGGEKAKIEKQARQLAYDTRYRVKKEVGDKNVNPAIMKQLLIKYLAKSTAAPGIKMRAKQMLLGEDYVGDTRDMASNSLANALFKVFVEGTRKDSDSIKLDYLQELAENPDKKYKVRVTDKKTGNSYVRFATREKITQLRANPNIQSVEMTEYGEPREGERRGGEDTARATGGGKGAKRDYDGDGKVESGSKEHAGAVHNAIQRATGGTPDGKDTRKTVSASYEQEGELVEEKKAKKKKIKKWWDDDGDGIGWERGEVKKEEFIADASNLENKKITGKGVDNYTGGKNAVVKVFPDDGQDKIDGVGQKPSFMSIMSGHNIGGPILLEKSVSIAQQKFFNMIQEKKLTKAEEAKKEQIVKSLKPKYGKTSKTYAIATSVAKKVAEEKEEKKDKEYGCEDDSRAKYAEKEVIKNKLRAALGVKNPIVMTTGYEPEGEVLDEMGPLTGLAVRGVAALAAGLAGKGIADRASEAAKRLKEKQEKRLKGLKEDQMVDEQKYAVFTTSGETKITENPPWKASPAALVKPIKPTGRSRYRDENPYRARPGESD